MKFTITLGSANFASHNDVRGEVVLRPGKLFEVGDFPDKRFSLSEAEADAAVRAFASPVPMNVEHQASIFDGAVGEVRRIWRDGQNVLAEFAIPAFLHNLAQTKGVPLKVSAEWDRTTKRLKAAAWVLSPRIRDAELAAAFSASHQGHSTGRRSHFMRLSKDKIRELLRSKNAEISDAEIDACFAEESQSNARKDAESFAREMLVAERTTPAELNLVAALFYQALMDDEANSTTVTFAVTDPDSKEGKDKEVSGSRADLVRAMFESRPKHGMLTESLPSAQEDRAERSGDPRTDAVFSLGSGAHRPDSGSKGKGPEPIPASKIYSDRRKATEAGRGR